MRRDNADISFARPALVHTYLHLIIEAYRAAAAAVKFLHLQVDCSTATPASADATTPHRCLQSQNSMTIAIDLTLYARCAARAIVTAKWIAAGAQSYGAEATEHCGYFSTHIAEGLFVKNLVVA